MQKLLKRAEKEGKSLKEFIEERKPITIKDLVKKGKVEKFEIFGHTDSDDTDEYNQVLSENRANSVKDFLIKNGVTANITTTGFGEKKPIATNSTKEGKQLNRRVEIVIPTV